MLDGRRPALGHCAFLRAGLAGTPGAQEPIRAVATYDCSIQKNGTGSLVSARQNATTLSIRPIHQRIVICLAPVELPRDRGLHLQRLGHFEGVEAPRRPLDGAVQAVLLAGGSDPRLPPQRRHRPHAHPARGDRRGIRPRCSQFTSPRTHPCGTNA